MFFVMKLCEKCFAALFSLFSWKFSFTHREDFFILFQFLISSILITQIVRYSFLLMRPYFASILSPTVTNISSVSFFIALKINSHSMLNLTESFYIFQAYFGSCYFLSLFLLGLLLHRLQSFVGLVC